jgi:two-component system response regulator AtoC
MDQTILVVDDEQDFLDSIRRGLLLAGFRNIILELSAKNAAALFDRRESGIDIALLDITMPGMNGVELLEYIKEKSPDTACIIVTAVNDAETAVSCLKKGAYDYLVKPISKDDLVATIHRALEKKILFDLLTIHKKKRHLKLLKPSAFQFIITQSNAVWSVLKEAELHAMSDIPILITGESGTGKDLLARALHAASPRAALPFTPVNMASLPDTLFDAAFYGHAKGSFTGATENRQGYLEMTHHGSLFMDEVGNIPLEFQMKLLRVLEKGEFMKLGTGKLQTADVRFISATNMDLEKLIANGSFRKDFYYRLNGAWLHLPPLRERREDIPLLIQKFMGDYTGRRTGMEIDSSATALLMNYDSPGNIRELKSIISAAVNLAQDKAITLECLPAPLRKKTRQPSSRAIDTLETAVLSIREVEKEHIINVYNKQDNNKSQTAKLLGIGLNTLRRKLQEYGIP